MSQRDEGNALHIQVRWVSVGAQCPVVDRSEVQK